MFTLTALGGVPGLGAVDFAGATTIAGVRLAFFAAPPPPPLRPVNSVLSHASFSWNTKYTLD